MRTKRAPRNGAGTRRPLALVAAAGLFIMIAAALAACSGGASSSSAVAAAAAISAGPTAAAAAGAAAPARSLDNGGAQSTAFGTSGVGAAVTNADAKFVASTQKLIYTAQLSVRAPSVSAALSRATSIVSGAGGYVSTEHTSSDPAHPGQSTASVTFKIPVAAYDATLASLSGTALGTQLSLTQQAQDVTQQVADVSSRVRSDEAGIAQLRTLLKHAGSVSELLTVQNQINSEESDLESMLSQQSALDHETSYATLTLTVVGPKPAPKPVVKPKPKPLAGWSGGLSDGWHALRMTISWLLTAIGTVAPFAIAIALIGGLAWWARRVRRRGEPPA